MSTTGALKCLLIAVCQCFIVSDSFLVPDGLQKVNTQYGEIHGIQASAELDGQKYVVNKFLGIPYAEPPIGNLRFKKPTHLRQFPSPLKALAYGPICPQSSNVRGNIIMSEDCLTLNVIVPFPHGANVLRKPVMIWIHGGWFTSGSSKFYDPEVLSAFTDVIVVTVNYRLGALGFFTTSDGECPGNFGLWDQQFAIQWVKNNIASFGGDSENITIFGESAGSSSVIFQTLYAGNKGLFKRAIAESGTLAAWALSSTDSVYRNSIAFAKYVGCTSANHASMMACMRHKSPDDLLIAVQSYKIATPHDLQPPWIPVHDNDFTIEDPVHMLSNAKSGSPLYSFFREVDLMIGWNNVDGGVYLPEWMAPFNRTSPKDYAVSESQLKFVFAPRIAEIALSASPKAASIQRVRQEFLSSLNQLNADDRVKLLLDLATDAFLVAPTARTVLAHTGHASSTYVYRFGAKPTYRFLPLPSYLDDDDHANHADELQFVFGMKLPGLVFKDPSLIPQPNRNQIRVSKAVMTMWSNFAKSGNPNKPRNVGKFFNISWQQYYNGRPSYLEITNNMSGSSSRSRPFGASVDFWNNILPSVQSSA